MKWQLAAQIGATFLFQFLMALSVYTSDQMESARPHPEGASVPVGTPLQTLGAQPQSHLPAVIRALPPGTATWSLAALVSCWWQGSSP